MNAGAQGTGELVQDIGEMVVAGIAVAALKMQGSGDSGEMMRRSS